MTNQDKYGIQAKIQEVLQAPETHHMFASCPDLIVSAIWEEVYLSMPLCDPEDSSPYRVVEILKSRYGDGLKVEESCGLTSVITLHLPNSICYLDKCQRSYYILPMHKMVRRFYTRLEPEVAADLILEFDRFAPIIFRKIEEKKQEHRQREIIQQLLKESAIAIIESLKREHKINVPDEVRISGTTAARISICFKSHKAINCPLDQVESILIERFGKE